MGTNYYLHTEPCEHCGMAAEPMHIGKSSVGWCFSLHAIPERGISSLDDWIGAWSRPGVFIEDEDGSRVSPKTMLGIITGRHCEPARQHTEGFLAANYAEEGPNGLLRSRVDGEHCTAHGAGTWDIMTGTFS